MLQVTALTGFGAGGENPSAIEVVGSVSGGNTNGNDVTLDLTGLALQEGDFIFVHGGCIVAGSSSAGASTSGYTLDKAANLSSTIDAWTGYKFMGSTVDTEFVGLGDGNSTDSAVYTAFALRYVDPDTPMDATTVAVGNTSGASNSQSIITNTDNAMVFSMFVHNITTTSVTSPSGYSTSVLDETFKNAADTYWTTSGMAYKRVATATTENPGAWSVNNGFSWIAMTAAIKPKYPDVSP